LEPVLGGKTEKNTAEKKAYTMFKNTYDIAFSMKSGLS